MAAKIAVAFVLALAGLWGVLVGPVLPSFSPRLRPDREVAFNPREFLAGLAASALPGGILAKPTADAAAAPADARITREGRGRVTGGVVFVPASFRSDDGTYDVLVHFHGNTAVVHESAEAADLNAIVVVVNWGVGSAPYEEAYDMPGTYEHLIEQIDVAVAERGLERPKLRRIALSSWSAGYGAISTILKRRKGNEPLDAVLVLDGIHVGWDLDSAGVVAPKPSDEAAAPADVDELGAPAAGEPAAPAPRVIRPTKLDARNLAPFIGLAKDAAAGDLLFTITHADVKPEGYAGAADTASFLLESVGGERLPRYGGERPSLGLRSAVGAMPKKMEKKLELTTEARVGGLHIRGYSGATPEHHMCHLLEMGQTVLPELVERWQRESEDP